MNAVQSNYTPLAAFIFDLDGSMVDTLGDFAAVFDRLFGDLRLTTVRRTFVELMVGQGSEHLIRLSLAEVGADPVLYE